MIAQLGFGKRIINVDETLFNETNFVRKSWTPVQTRKASALKAVQPSLAMITSLDSDGRVFFALSHSTTDQDSFMVFMRHLVAKMDNLIPGWQESSIILIDNAPYHSGEEIRDYLHKMEVPIMFSGPYSYSAAPIESLFSLLKFGEINKEAIATGKSRF